MLKRSVGIWSIVVLVAAAAAWMCFSSDDDLRSVSVPKDADKSRAENALLSGATPSPPAAEPHSAHVSSVASKRMEVRDGFGRSVPGLALRARYALEGTSHVVAMEVDASGRFAVPAFPEGVLDDKIALHVEGDRIAIVTKRWTDAVSLGHVLVALPTSLKGHLRLVGARESELPRLHRRVVFTLQPLLDVAYRDRGRRRTALRGLHRANLGTRSLAAGELEFDRTTGAFRLVVPTPPEARLLVSLAGWTSFNISLEEAASLGGDLGRIDLEPLPTVGVRVTADPGIPLPKVVMASIWRSVGDGDPARAEATAGVKGAGGDFVMFRPRTGLWTIGQSTGAHLDENGSGEMRVPRGFEVALKARALPPDVLATQRVASDGTVRLHFGRPDHPPDVQVLWQGKPAAGRTLVVADIDHPTQVNRTLALTSEGRFLREHLAWDHVYSLDLRGVGDSQIRFLAWRPGITEVKFDELPTQPPSR